MKAKNPWPRARSLERRDVLTVIASVAMASTERRCLGLQSRAEVGEVIIYAIKEFWERREPVSTVFINSLFKGVMDFCYQSGNTF